MSTINKSIAFIAMVEAWEESPTGMVTRRQVWEKIKEIWPDRINPEADLHLAHILNHWVDSKCLVRRAGKFYERGKEWSTLTLKYASAVTQFRKSKEVRDALL